MSVYELTWKATGIAGADRLMLLAIAHQADTGEAWSEASQLAAMCRVTVRSAQRTVTRLEAAGWIVSDECGRVALHPKRVSS